MSVRWWRARDLERCCSDPIGCGAQRKRETGFSLLEVLVASVIGSLVLLAVGSLIALHGGLSRRVQARLESIATAQWALLVVARDVELAGSDPIRAGIVGLRYGSATRVDLAADWNGDGRIDDRSAELVKISWAATGGGKLSRQLGSQSMPLAIGVPAGGFRLRYFTATGEVVPPAGAGGLDVASLARVRRIDLELMIEPTVAALRAQPEARVHLLGSAAIRSRREAV